MFYDILEEATVNEPQLTNFIRDLNFNVHSFNANHLTTIGDTSNVTTSYWVENLYLPFGVSIKNTHEFKWYRVTCWNGMEGFWKGSKALWYCSWNMTEKQKSYNLQKFLNVSLHFERMANSSRKFSIHIQKFFIFQVIQYIDLQKQSVGWCS